MIVPVHTFLKIHLVFSLVSLKFSIYLSLFDIDFVIGVINSQIFRGFAEGLVDVDEISVKELSEAFENGVKVKCSADDYDAEDDVVVSYEIKNAKSIGRR